jgi:predicted nucleic acid-binding Zn finger protein
MIISDARWETPEERVKRESFRTAKDRKEESISWCNENYKQLIKWHSDFSLYYPEKLKEKELQRREQTVININENNKRFNEVVSGNEVFCRCGGRLKYINKFNFCGCENYSNKLVYHTTLNLQTYNNDTPIIIDIGKNYLNEFKKAYKIDHIMASIIHKTLQAYGEPLLVEIEDEYFNTARNASFRSKTEEKIVLEILNKRFPKCYHQIGIKVLSDKKWTTKIPDYVCMDGSGIYVFDAKLALRNIDNSQLLTYHKAVQIIAEKSKIYLPVKSYFIIYEPELENELPFNCLTVSMLRNL